ncbi:MAG: HYR domain-containing protein [Saprospiraceae bacterium]|nr:HYR domain-containing protein [Saprospiraceae bacterium]
MMKTFAFSVYSLLVWGIMLCPEFSNAQAYCDPDNVPPVIVNCHPDMTFTIPSGECGTTVTWSDPFADPDNCLTTSAISAVDFFSFHEGDGNGNNGQLLLHGTDSLTIVGTTNGTPGNGNNVFNVCFYATCSGQLSFNWRARMNNGDGFANDRVRLTITHMVHGANVNANLTTGNGSTANGLVASTLIQEGDRFCLEVVSDNTLGVDSITITNFIFVPGQINVIQTNGPKPGDIIPQGIYPVEYTASDCAGNISTCSFNVEVVLETPRPLISFCQNDTTITINLPGRCDMLVDYLIPTTFDPCKEIVGFNLGMDPTMNGIQLTEAAEPGNGDGIVGTDGFVYVSPGKDSLVLVGINNGTPGSERNDTSVLTTCIQPRCPGIFTFDWRASIGFGGFRRDEAGIIFNGKDSILSTPPGGSFEFGTVTIHSNGIDPLCFYVRSTSMAMEDTFIITNFNFVSDSIIPLQVSGPDLTQPIQPGVYDIGFQVRDCYGNIDSCSFNLTILRIGSMSCKNLNISLNENCESLITQDMVVSGLCTNTMVVDLSHYGKPVSNPIDSHYLGQHITATVRDTLTGNSCWGDLFIEDKLSPLLICRADTTDCYSFNHDFPLNYTVQDCSPYKVTTIGERVEHLDCDSNFLKIIYRDVLITDINGNAESCTDTIYVRRIKVTDLVLPNGITTLTCEYKIFIDNSGYPAVLYTGFPLVNLYNGSSIGVWPLNSLLDCNLLVSYEDLDLGEINCVRKIMRTWTAREWWCGTEITRTEVQLIIIEDLSGPQITHAPYGFEATTGRRDCEARVLLPSIEAFDYCHNDLRIDIAYPGGVLLNQNGGYVNLPVGEDTIYYRVYDGCYNLTEHYIIIHVRDETEPVAVCDRNTVVALNHSGYNWVPAEVFDDGSFDECALHHFEVRRMEAGYCGTRGEDDWGPEVGFCCEDVGKTVMVGFKAIDHSGNEAICMVNVEVQDKEAPQISCPPNITVDCRFDIDFNNLDVFGKVVTEQADRDTIIIDPIYWHQIGGHPLDGLAKDNCPPEVVVTEDRGGLNQCGIGYLYRHFFARDQQDNVSNLCVQIISIINHDTFDINDIDFPDDYATSGICNPAELIPERLTYPYNKPVVNDDECSLIGYSYHDHVLSASLPGDPCFKIIRVWKVIDWCQRDIDGNVIIWTDTQYIKVTNLIDPIIKRVSQDTVICSYDVNCRPIPVVFRLKPVMIVRIRH